MSDATQRARWIDRQLPVWRAWLAAVVSGAVVAVVQSGEPSSLALAATVTGVGLFPPAVALAMAITVACPGETAASLGSRVRTWLAERAPLRVAAPLAWALPLPIAFGVMRSFVESALVSFRTLDLLALLLAAVAVAVAVSVALLAWVLQRGLAGLVNRVAHGKRPWLPLASVGASLAWAGGCLVACAVGFAVASWSRLQFAGVTSLWVIAAAYAAFGAAVATWVVRGGPQRRWTCNLVDGLSVIGIGLVGLGLLAPHTSANGRAWLGRAPAYGPWLAAAVSLTDYDDDGVSSLLGGDDCDPFDKRVHPGALDVANDGLDQNCSGGDYDGAPFVPDDPGYVGDSQVCPRGDCNVVFITFDSFRADELAIFGASREVMPFLESRARAGVAFANAYSPGPGTMTTVPCMLAGRFDSTLKMDPRIARRHPVHASERLLSDSLQQAGIRTHAVFEHRMLDPLGHGWDTFYNPWRPDYASRSTAALQFDRLHEVVRASEHERFFVYAHVLETHHDFMPHEGFEAFGVDERGRYRGELAYVDSLLRDLVETIERDVTERPTVFIVAGDHGEGFGEHGIVKHNEGLYRALTWVPLIVWSPHATRPARYDAPVSLFDVAPTVRNLFGLPPRTDHVGISLLPAIERGIERTERTIYNQAIYDEQGVDYNLVGITVGPHRLLHDMRKQTYELYDVASDPDELVERSAQDPDRVVSMRRQMTDWLERIEHRADYVHRPWERGRGSR